MTFKRKGRSAAEVHSNEGSEVSTAAIDAAIEKEQEDEEQTEPLGPTATLVRRITLIVIFPAFSLFYLTQALTIDMPNRELPVSPRGFPTAVAVVMLIVTVTIAIVEIVRLARHRQAASSGLAFGDPEDDDRERINDWPAAWVTLATLTVYILAFSFLGFAISTFAFLVGVSTYLQPRSWLRNIIVSAFFSVLVYLLFANLLGVQLPAGLLKGIL